MIATIAAGKIIYPEDPRLKQPEEVEEEDGNK